MSLITNFMTILSAVLQLLHADRKIKLRCILLSCIANA